jgi:hypothetical protein
MENPAKKNQAHFEKFVDACAPKTYSRRNVSYSQVFHIFRTRGEKGGNVHAR